MIMDKVLISKMSDMVELYFKDRISMFSLNGFLSATAIGPFKKINIRFFENFFARDDYADAFNTAADKESFLNCLFGYYNALCSSLGNGKYRPLTDGKYKPLKSPFEDWILGFYVGVEQWEKYQQYMDDKEFVQLMFPFSCIYTSDERLENIKNEMKPAELKKLVRQIEKSFPKLIWTMAHYIEKKENFRPSSKHQKTGRNDPCPCGSGKKYKQCCINK